MNAPKFSSLLIYGLCLSLILFVLGCGDSNYGETADGGSITFSVDWADAPTLENQPGSGASRALDCVAAGVSSVEAVVYDGSDNNIATGGPWVCTLGAGTIGNVPAGTGYRVEILGKDIGGSVLHQGEVTGITVTAGQSNSAGEIVATTAIPKNLTAAAGGGRYVAQLGRGFRGGFL